ncbi:hypothetical protein KSP39_PZI018831 [Platanthera zijinensis]|uniref:Pectinesterase inhibitor domain-containing protein n=1 Tax=Platanthera zijinensis TaxID=2320716 RepID=A0AAP0FYD6_9ASPA
MDAVNLTAANATDSLSTSTSDNAFVRSALRKCSTMYAAASPDLRRSTEAAESRNYTAAAVVLSAVLSIPSACDETFVTEDGVAVASPIYQEGEQCLL